jgi:peptidyl-prolyl cis-trans isomerase B (cyclophilin B)
MKITKMKKIRIISILLCVAGITALISFTGCRKSGDFSGNMSDIGDAAPGDVYAVITFRDFEGELYFKLFEDIAPVGVAKFIEIAEWGHDNAGYYAGKNLHRVLKDTLIQGGALNTDGSDPEIESELFEVEAHDNARNFYGALGFAVSEENGMNFRQFYIVTANKPVHIDEQAEQLREILNNAPEGHFTAAQTREFERRHRDMTRMSRAVKERYEKKGGYHWLDGKTTVFGQLITGHELLREIASVEVVRGNSIDDDNPELGGGNGQPSRPANNIFIEEIRIIRFGEEDE